MSRRQPPYKPLNEQLSEVFFELTYPMAGTQRALNLQAWSVQLPANMSRGCRREILHFLPDLKQVFPGVWFNYIQSVQVLELSWQWLDRADWEAEDLRDIPWVEDTMTLAWATCAYWATRMHRIGIFPLITAVENMSRFRMGDRAKEFVQVCVKMGRTWKRDHEVADMTDDRLQEGLRLAPLTAVRDQRNRIGYETGSQASPTDDEPSGDEDDEPLQEQHYEPHERDDEPRGQDASRQGASREPSQIGSQSQDNGYGAPLSWQDDERYTSFDEAYREPSPIYVRPYESEYGAPLEWWDDEQYASFDEPYRRRSAMNCQPYEREYDEALDW